MKNIPDFSFEIAANVNIVAGVDEAGRGPLCGPVVAAAVIFPKIFYENMPDVLITDSKQMSKQARENAYNWIIDNTIWGVGQCSPSEIDEINILQASLLAMKRAVANLSTTPDWCLIDGNKLPCDLAGQSIIKGDSRSISIAAASIIAKETRDKIMSDLSNQFPEYSWEKNSGYPTPSHLQAIAKYGINNPHFRKTFKPIKDLL